MWIGAGVGETTLTGSTLTLVSSLSAGALLLRPFTVMRTHITVVCVSDQEAVDERPLGSFGMLVVTDTAAALGVTALPNPSGISGDPEAAWYAWQSLYAQVLVDSASGVHPSNYAIPIDSKAMRKVGPDDNIVMLVDVESAPGLLIQTNGRMLIQLH